MRKHFGTNLWWSPAGAGTDFCTVTVSRDSARTLLARTLVHEPGNAQRGFKRSERRACLGGYVWRKWDPISPSSTFGDEYESWETEGIASRWLDRETLALNSRPSRQDYAFDFCVDDDLFPRALLPVFRPHLDARGIIPEFQGPENSCTVYFGSRQSARRVKIYRRDLKDPALIADGFPPMMRIELELRDEAGRALWAHRQATGADGLPEACTHIADLIGHRVTEDAAELPEPSEASPDADAFQLVFQFIEQHAATVDAICGAGIDLPGLAAARVATLSQAARYRQASKVDKLHRADPRAVERMVRDRLGFRFFPPPELAEGL